MVPSFKQRDSCERRELRVKEERFKCSGRSSPGQGSLWQSSNPAGEVRREREGRLPGGRDTLGPRPPGQVGCTQRKKSGITFLAEGAMQERGQMSERG